MSFSDRFAHFAKTTATATGRPLTFLVAVVVILAWAVTGPIFQFNDTWQLVINTGTTIVTFLMVFLIQNTQNRDAIAMQIKLDELIRSIRGAHNTIVSLEELGEADLERVKAIYDGLAARARAGGAIEEELPELKGAIREAQVTARQAHGHAAEAEETAEEAEGTATAAHGEASDAKRQAEAARREAHDAREEARRRPRSA